MLLVLLVLWCYLQPVKIGATTPLQTWVTGITVAEFLGDFVVVCRDDALVIVEVIMATEYSHHINQKSKTQQRPRDSH